MCRSTNRGGGRTFSFAAETFIKVSMTTHNGSPRARVCPKRLNSRLCLAVGSAPKGCEKRGLSSTDVCGMNSL